jgi:hypothetical protein
VAPVRQFIRICTELFHTPRQVRYLRVTQEGQQ